MPFALDSTLAADTHFVQDLALCRVLLMDDATYPWLILVPRRADLVELIDLPPSDQTVAITEIRQASIALTELYQPHKLNVAALGNQVRQLHIHVIARQTDDMAWPAPVWGAGPRSPYSERALSKTLDSLRTKLETA